MQKIEKFLFSGFIAGVIFIAFALGGLVVHYQWEGGQWFLDALESADAWHQSKLESDEEAENERLDADNPDPIDNSIVTWNKEKTDNGYTLLTVRKLQQAYLVDMEGKVVYSWTLKPEEMLAKNLRGIKPVVYISDALVLPNGDLIVGFMLRGYSPYGVGIVKIDKHSNVLWTFLQNNHHDVHLDRDTGNIYTLTHRFTSTRGKEGLENLPRRIMNDYIVILSPQGEVLDEISLLDAFLDTPFAAHLYHEILDKAPWDEFHTNTVMKLDASMADKFPMFKAGQMLLSIRNMSAVAVLDPKTRKIVWMQYGPWRLQHSAQFLPNGNIILFDNAGYLVEKERFSRIFEFKPGSSEMAWHYKGTPDAPFYTSTHGRVQRLAGGNTLINEANNGRLFEVTPAGEIVWDYQLPGKRGFDYAPVTILTSVRYHPEELPFLAENGGQ